ncbi:TPA: anaerobic C4-dicarboxylate transporter [Campylobacter fetus subsp. venerealis]|uniref:Anaerobic C4-dicarboxylate transporter, DcuA/DcuB family n=2 Tax=Campylobacter fetus TaxID=196 RepID=A0AAE6IX46_CAMFE|nr:anaerobic C4-dicarboxylate transporter [Campylobacter fetus]OCS22567.1 C4-dicarboxylate ABC transporter [Campylobacter fetus subsp. venerealis cfvi97/532]OCS25384.1 C4-dicarboxylate ABC transporter [Campylobacter fetus subsp. venerealis cfvB10]OCS29962.1 C4-dicarboxylate ABC transporter [Campylobacter fetus subsp. venerealis LMG 6570 = CCUG 33900]OCS41769.1 C4-dicarboxylate ABC transporter [Campylobacter fetus subsp. venerealis cfvi02/298]AHE93498.1 anaerobic C4-dicarboxylate transporter [C
MDFLINLSEGWQFTIQLLIVLICLFYGAKKGGIALGLLGGIGLIVLVFAFGIQPGKPAIAVMLTILAVVVASATLQASGGLDVMLQISEKVLRKNPKYISILAPFVTSTLTILCGTGHVVYTMLPIVYDVAIKNGIRPERPMAASSIASQMGIIASPVSVAVVTLTAFLISADHHLAGFDGYLDLLKITIPSTYLGVLCVGMFSWFRGKDLDKDLEFQGRIKDPEVKKYVYGDGTTLLGKKLPKTSWAAMWIFLGTIAVVATLGYFKDLRPAWNSNKDGAVVQIVATYPTEQKILEKIVLKDAKAEVSGSSIDISGSKVKNVANNISGLTITQKDGSKLMLSQNEQGSVIYTNVKGEVKEYPNSTISLSNKVASKTTLSMVDTIQIFMLLAGALILIFTPTNAGSIGKNEIFRSGMIALVAVFGISWMAETMFGVHTPMMKDMLGGVVTQYPWTYAIMLLLVSKFVNSQAAALVAFVPLALGIGVSPAIILAFAPACYGYYILPTYPSDLAAIQFDRSGTTHIGKYVINHSFIIPGLIGVISSCIFGYIFAGLYGYL